MTTATWRSNIVWAPLLLGGLGLALFLSSRDLIGLPLAIAMPLVLGAALARW